MRRIPYESNVSIRASVDVLVGESCVIWHAMHRWLSKPHKEPSGVWTAHRKPHASGSNFRTDVVFASVNASPRWTERKCDINRRIFKRSAIIEKPLVLIEEEFLFI